jgi:peptide/nickel transport system permease protein
LIVLSSFVAGIYPALPNAVDLPQRLQPPFSGGHPFGTDALGRDILSRVLHGARISLGVSAGTVLISALVGISLGVIAAQRGGTLDALIMRTTEILLGFPLIIVAILLAAVYGPSLTNVILIIGLFQWPQYARLARAQTLTVKKRQFVEAARVSGASTWFIVRRHYTPHLASFIVILASILAASAVQAEAGLSFLGAGVPPPGPSWGGMVSDGRQFITTAWWVAVFPGLAISIMVLCLNLMGDYLRDTLDPTLRASG